MIIPTLNGKEVLEGRSVEMVRMLARLWRRANQIDCGSLAFHWRGSRLVAKLTEETSQGELERTVPKT